jgi:hypothetical protein
MGSIRSSRVIELELDIYVLILHDLEKEDEKNDSYFDLLRAGVSSPHLNIEASS